MKVTYKPSETPEDAMPVKTSQFGYDFYAGKPVEVTDGGHLKKFEGNPYFEVADEKPAPLK